MTSRELDGLQKRGFIHFLGEEKAHLFNYVFASILFYAFGLPAVINYGYSGISYEEALKAQAADGSLPSGRYGQGAFPMTLMLYIVASGLFFSAAVRYYNYVPPSEEDEEMPCERM